MKPIVSGIDGGFSGEIVVRFSSGCWEVHRASFFQENGNRVLDIRKNLAVLFSMADRGGGMDRLLVVYERSRKNTLWGVKRSFAGGRTEEFWRVALTLSGFRFTSVDPTTGQAWCFRGMDKDEEPKIMAMEFVRRHCPDVAWLDRYSQAERLCIVDAMCITMWAENQLLGPTSEDCATS